MTTSDAVAGSGRLEVLPVGDIAGDFHIPSYQRGYRWREHEVRQLLDDIRDSDGATYYLQPIVVKSRGDGSWELVDGQQRLTTLYLIIRYLQEHHLPSAATGYTLTYETRSGSQAYLETLDEELARTNIDYSHMFDAYQCIEQWFAAAGHRDTREAIRLFDRLSEPVKVLWYEAPPGVDATELFTRLNVGRIPLTDAELVKALLLSRGVTDGRSDRSVEIAAHWDLIERELRVPEVWAFVTGSDEEAPTHISLLLDALAGGPTGSERPTFHTFETLRPQIDEDPDGFWRKVVHLHSLVLGWYEDRSLFHRVGYLIAVGRTFGELVRLAAKKGRSQFELALDDAITEHLQLSTGQLADLQYPSSVASDVLLLANVETIRRMANSSERYSFRAHAAGHWSLEHIHAQNAEPLTTKEQWTAWLQAHRAALEDLPNLEEARRASLLDTIDEVLDSGVTQATFNSVESEVTSVFSAEQEDDVDSLDNLALLDMSDNAALSNSVFEVKRREMIKRDREHSYIPACTRNVFLKYYTDAGAQQLHFWSAEDRASYLSAIEDLVSPYLRVEEGEE